VKKATNALDSSRDSQVLTIGRTSRIRSFFKTTVGTAFLSSLYFFLHEFQFPFPCGTQNAARTHTRIAFPHLSKMHCSVEDVYRCYSVSGTIDSFFQCVYFPHRKGDSKRSYICTAVGISRRQNIYLLKERDRPFFQIFKIETFIVTPTATKV
jgi:hypothetical protein